MSPVESPSHIYSGLITIQHMCKMFEIVGEALVKSQLAELARGLNHEISDAALAYLALVIIQRQFGGTRK